MYKTSVVQALNVIKWNSHAVQTLIPLEIGGMTIEASEVNDELTA